MLRSVAVRHDGPRLIALGVLSRANSPHRRRNIRSTWGGQINTSEVLLRFVLAVPQNQSVRRAMKAEQSKYGDIYIAGDERSGYFVVTLKTLAWLEHVLTWHQPPPFVAIADDDVYLVMRSIVDDISHIATSVPTAVYSAFEWFAIHRNLGLEDAWGQTIRSVAGTTYAWRAAAGVPRTVWPGGESGGRPCSRCSINERRRQLRCRQCWSGCNRSLVDGSGSALSERIDQLRSHNTTATGLSRPFPLAKGTFLAWGLRAAASLVRHPEARRELVHGTALAREGRRILHDVFLSHVMAAPRASRGLANLSLVDMGIWTVRGSRRGFAEYRVHPNGSHLPFPSGVRVVHIGARTVKRQVLVQWPDAGQHWRRRQAEMLAHNFRVLHAAFGDARAPRRLTPPRRLVCARPNWFEESRCVITAGMKDWTTCEIRSALHMSQTVRQNH